VGWGTTTTLYLFQRDRYAAETDYASTPELQHSITSNVGARDICCLGIVGLEGCGRTAIALRILENSHCELGQSPPSSKIVDQVGGDQNPRKDRISPSWGRDMHGRPGFTQLKTVNHPGLRSWKKASGGKSEGHAAQSYLNMEPEREENEVGRHPTSTLKGTGPK